MQAICPRSVPPSHTPLCWDKDWLSQRAPWAVHLGILRSRHYQTMSSPKKMVLSLEHEPMMGSLGWNTASLTLPLWPGSLYSSLRDAASQMYTERSEEPAVT